MMDSPNMPQKKPHPGRGRAIPDLVVADIRERDAAGTKKYGQRLQAHDGRNHLIDAYQEALDLVMYLRQEIEERATAPAQPSGNPGELPVCPVCFDAATYQTPDGRYWCSRAHWWRHIECDECQGMRVRVYPGTLLGQVETCRKCNGKATAAPHPDCSAAQPASDETTGCADDAIPGAVVDAIREHLAAQPATDDDFRADFARAAANRPSQKFNATLTAQPATEQPRIWRTGHPSGPFFAPCDEPGARRLAEIYSMCVQFSTDNGKTWIDEQAGEP